MSLNGTLYLIFVTLPGTAISRWIASGTEASAEKAAAEKAAAEKAAAEKAAAEKAAAEKAAAEEDKQRLTADRNVVPAAVQNDKKALNHEITLLSSLVLLMVYFLLFVLSTLVFSLPTLVMVLTIPSFGETAQLPLAVACVSQLNSTFEVQMSALALFVMVQYHEHHPAIWFCGVLFVVSIIVNSARQNQGNIRADAKDARMKTREQQQKFKNEILADQKVKYQEALDERRNQIANLLKNTGGMLTALAAVLTGPFASIASMIGKYFLALVNIPGQVASWTPQPQASTGSTEARSMRCFTMLASAGVVVMLLWTVLKLYASNRKEFRMWFEGWFTLPCSLLCCYVLDPMVATLEKTEKIFYDVKTGALRKATNFLSCAFHICRIACPILLGYLFSFIIMEHLQRPEVLFRQVGADEKAIDMLDTASQSVYAVSYILPMWKFTTIKKDTLGFSQLCKFAVIFPIMTHMPPIGMAINCTILITAAIIYAAYLEVTATIEAKDYQQENALNDLDTEIAKLVKESYDLELEERALRRDNASSCAVM
jgi:hypothetical protein